MSAQGQRLFQSHLAFFWYPRIQNRIETNKFCVKEALLGFFVNYTQHINKPESDIDTNESICVPAQISSAEMDTIQAQKWRKIKVR